MKLQSFLDQGGQVRSGEELDIVAVHDWLIDQIPDVKGQAKVTQYSGGASNWTYRLEYENYDLILRRPPSGTKAKSAHDMGREFQVQNALKSKFPIVPQMHAFCEDETVIGCQFYIMDRIEGIIPRANLPKGLNINQEQTQKLCTQFIDKLIELHQVDYQSIGLEQLGKGQGYTQRQITGWTDRYHKAKTWNVPKAKYVTDWLKANTPDDCHTCVIHNDYRFDNIVLNPDDPTQLIGLLDWEMATLGDPLMDLGNSIAYWIQADDDKFAQSLRRQPTHLNGMFTREEVVEYYCDKMGLETENWDFYHVYGLFRLSVIVQQIYYRYHHKQTRNPAFKHFWLIAQYMIWKSRRIIKLSQL